MALSNNVGQPLTARPAQDSHKGIPRAYWACGFRGPMFPAIAPDFTARRRLGWRDEDTWGPPLRIPGEERVRKPVNSERGCLETRVACLEREVRELRVRVQTKTGSPRKGGIAL